jgi:type I restriction enzyme S subunit
MKVYPDYKESGVEWMKAIPKHWKISKFSFHFKTGMGETILSNNLIDNGIYPVFSATESDTIFGYFNDPKIILDAGDLIIPARGVSIGHVKYVQKKCTCTQTTIYAKNISKDNLVPRFVYYFLIGNRKILFFYDRTAIPQITCEQVNANRILVPPLPEQQVIANFLDRKTAQIDALIEKKQRQIDILQEQRTALINHAVTKGLNPDAPMKDSGVEWLGEVPSHWIVSKIRRACSSVRDGTHAPPPRANGVHRLLSVRNIVDNEFITRDDDRTMTPEDFEILQKSYTVEQGDVVLAIVGATTGKSAIVGKLDNVTVQRSLAVLRPSDKMESSFLNFWLKTAFVKNNIQRIMTIYSAQPGIYLDDLSNLRVLVPPIDEQSSITKWLLLQTKNIQASINRMQQQIELIQEYRTALISEAVTGKIDVRTAETVHE